MSDLISRQAAIEAVHGMRMSDAYDYSKTILSQGLVCYNTNNHNYCVVIDGRRGSDDDRASLVLEFCGSDGFMMHTPPNRALVPTGRIKELRYLAKAMRTYVIAEEMEK